MMDCFIALAFGCAVFGHSLTNVMVTHNVIGGPLLAQSVRDENAYSVWIDSVVSTGGPGNGSISCPDDREPTVTKMRIPGTSKWRIKITCEGAPTS